MALYSLTDGLLFSTGEEKPKKRLPNPVTLPRRGPLILQTTQMASHGPATHRDTHRRVYTNPVYHQRPRHSLTRFPVVTARRPIEEIERELGEMLCAELWEAMDDWQQHKSTHLPHLHPMMKYSPIHSSLHSNARSHPQVQQYIHHDQGPMNISITYSRHLPSPHSPPHTTSGYRHTHTRAYTHPAVSKLWTGNGTRTFPSSSFHAKAETEPGWRFVSPRQYTSTSVHTTLAPHAVQAVATHRLKPITADTVVRGKKIRTLAS